MKYAPEQILELLPKERDFWFVKEIAEAFNVSTRAVQYAAKKNKLGTKVRQGPNGTYVFQEEDLEALCESIYGEVGNPINLAKSREKEHATNDK
jgi:transcriptional antiterminator